MGTREIFERPGEIIPYCQNILVIKTPSPLSSSISSGSSRSSLRTAFKEFSSSDLIQRFENLKNIASGCEDAKFSNDRINEKDEEKSSMVCRASTQNISGENSAGPEIARDQKTKMCSSSAPETMRLEKQTYEHRLQDFTKDLRKPMIRNFDERRPAKFLQPLRPQSREILRSNAPPLCLTDKKIVELLRRGSMSAREEYLKKSANAARKLVGLRQPTGMIIKNLSSDSEDDNCTSEWIITNSSSSNVKNNVAKTEANTTGNEISLGNEMPDFSKKMHNRGNESFDIPQSTRSVKLSNTSSNTETAKLIEEIEISDHSQNSKNGRSIQKSLQSSMAELRSVLNSVEIKSRDSRPVAVPKLEIQSQEYSQSTSVASREDSAKRPLDMTALMSALSDVSLKQRKFGDCKVPRVCNNVVSVSQEPESSRRISERGSRQSTASAEIIELQKRSSNYTLLQNSSRTSMATTKCVERSCSRSKIVAGETYDKVIRNSPFESQINSERKVAVHYSVVPERDHNSKINSSRISSTGNTSKSQSVHSVDTEGRVVRPIKLYSPPMRRSRQLKSPRTTRTDSSSSREISSRVAKSRRSSDCKLENGERHKRKATKVIAGPVKVPSEPCSMRNGQKIRQDNVLSSRVASSAREILSGVLRDRPRSSDEKYKYLQRGSQIPYVLGTSSDSSSEVEEPELQQKIVKSSVIDCQRNDESKTDRQFKIYEDTDEASPRSQLTPSADEFNGTAENAAANASQASREIRKINSKCLRPNVLTEIGDSKLYSSPEDSIRLNNPRGELPFSQESAESANVFWADSSSELNRAMGSSFESSQVTESEVHSRPMSPKTVVGRKKSIRSSCRSSSKKSSSKSSKATESSVSPKFSCDENTRTVSKNLAADAVEYFVANAECKSEKENIFPAPSIAKRLSYSEMKEAPTDGEKTPICKSHFQEASSTEEFIDDLGLNSSQANLAATNGRSDGAVHLFREAFDRTTSRVKVASSLSKLKCSPDDQRMECSNFFTARRSQDRVSFTISESSSGKSLSQCKTKQTVQEFPGNKIVEPSRTAYGLSAHPSILRLASADTEATTAEIIQTVSCDPNIRAAPSPKIPRLRRFLGFSWRKSGNKKYDHGSEIKTTRILYRNNKCRGDSADGSSISANSVSTENPRRQFDRDDLWVEGLRGEENLEGDEMTNNCLVKIGESDDKEQQYEEDRFSFFLAKTKSTCRKVISAQTFDAKTPMNSLIDEDPDVEVDPGCLCARFCLFLIDGSAHRRHRSTFRLRNRRSKIRRTF